jgi:mannosyl-oligosaccharide glucosidase
MDGYGWTRYDPRLGGTHIVHDSVNKLDLTTEFVKTSSGQHGGNWGVRVKGRPRMGAPEKLKSTVIFYMTMEQMESSNNSRLECADSQDGDDYHGAVDCQGRANLLGSFKIRTLEAVGNRPPMQTGPESHERLGHTTIVKSLTVPENKIWQAKGECSS